MSRALATVPDHPDWHDTPAWQASDPTAAGCRAKEPEIFSGRGEEWRYCP